jgi:hypothetical protein
MVSRVVACNLSSAGDGAARVYVFNLWKRVSNSVAHMWIRSECDVDRFLEFLDFQSVCIFYVMGTASSRANKKAKNGSETDARLDGDEVRREQAGAAAVALMPAGSRDT